MRHAPSMRCTCTARAGVHAQGGTRMSNTYPGEALCAQWMPYARHTCTWRTGRTLLKASCRRPHLPMTPTPRLGQSITPTHLAPLLAGLHRRSPAPSATRSWRHATWTRWCGAATAAGATCTANACGELSLRAPDPAHTPPVAPPQAPRRLGSCAGRPPSPPPTSIVHALMHAHTAHHLAVPALTVVRPLHPPSLIAALVALLSYNRLLPLPLPPAPAAVRPSTLFGDAAFLWPARWPPPAASIPWMEHQVQPPCPALLPAASCPACQRVDGAPGQVAGQGADMPAVPLRLGGVQVAPAAAQA